MREVVDAAESGDEARASRRVAIVCGKLPLPIRSGLDLRTLAIAKALAESAAVGVIAAGSQGSPPPSFAETWAAPPDLVHISQLELARTVLAGSSEPFAALFPPALRDHIRDELVRFAPDVVVVSRIQQWPLVETVRDVFTGPVVLDLDETAEPLAESILALGADSAQDRLRLRFLKAVAEYEKHHVGEADAVWVSSAMEAERARHAHRLAAVHVVPNAVEVPAATASRAPRSGILFPANLAYPPNVHAALEIDRLIAPRLPGLEFRIMGSYAVESLRNEHAPNVRVVSPVADMAAEFASAQAILLPIRAGGGTRVKALEAMAARTPVITTAKGVEGLDVSHGEHCLVGESTAELVDLVRSVIASPAALEPMLDRAYDVVLAHHSTRALAATLPSALP